MQAGVSSYNERLSDNHYSGKELELTPASRLIPIPEHQESEQPAKFPKGA